MLGEAWNEVEDKVNLIVTFSCMEMNNREAYGVT